MTLGEKRVRTNFNVSNDDFVAALKNDAAKYIDKIDQGLAVNPEFDKEKSGEFFRLKALALTAVEEAAMWAVKAATI